MNVIFISNYWHFPAEKASSRYHTLAEMCVSRGHDVEVLTSSFYHTAKQQRDLSLGKNDPGALSYRVTLLHTPGYAKNISLARVYDHHIFAKAVIQSLRKRWCTGRMADVIYLFVPPAELADRVVQFANRNGIRVVIDILDLWPKAFEMIVGKQATRLLLFPMYRQIRAAYRGADGIAAVSVHNAAEALRENRKVKEAVCVPIGISLSLFDRASKNARPLQGKLRPITMVYIGMLGKSYDLLGVLQVMRLLQEKGQNDAELLVMGDGPDLEKLKAEARRYDLPVRFAGRLSYEEMVQQLVGCDIALNVLVPGASGTVINKHADYAAAGLPIINAQSDTEFDEMLAAFGAGISCAPGNYSAMAHAVMCLCADEKLRLEMGKGSRHLAEQCFDREKTYPRLIRLLEEKNSVSERDTSIKQEITRTEESTGAGR